MDLAQFGHQILGCTVSLKVCQSSLTFGKRESQICCWTPVCRVWILWDESHQSYCQSFACCCRFWRSSWGWLCWWVLIQVQESLGIGKTLMQWVLQRSKLSSPSPVISPFAAKFFQERKKTCGDVLHPQHKRHTAELANNSSWGTKIYGPVATAVLKQCINSEIEPKIPTKQPRKIVKPTTQAPIMS